MCADVCCIRCMSVVWLCDFACLLCNPLGLYACKVSECLDCMSAHSGILENVADFLLSTTPQSPTKSDGLPKPGLATAFLGMMAARRCRPYIQRIKRTISLAWCDKNLGGKCQTANCCLCSIGKRKTVALLVIEPCHWQSRHTTQESGNEVKETPAVTCHCSACARSRCF